MSYAYGLPSAFFEPIKNQSIKTLTGIAQIVFEISHALDLKNVKTFTGNQFNW